MTTKSGSLVLTSEYFKIVIELVQETFKKKHNLKKLPKAFQLYGYGDYDESKASLKQDFEELGTEFINGKYLYDKSREISKGKNFVKLNEYYKSIILLYIGYENFDVFLDDNKLSENETEKQNALLPDADHDKTYYYINYYFGEDDVIIKGQTIITENWKKVKHYFIYPQEDGSKREHYSHGTIVKQGDTVYIRTKTLSGGNYVEGSSEIYYIGHKNPAAINYLVGTYCAFDIYTNPVAGRSILEKCESKAQMEAYSKSPIIPPYIALEVRNKRIDTNSVAAAHFLTLSNKSPYASIYGKIPGIYELTFELEDGCTEVMKFKILDTNYKLITLTENVYIEKDRIELLNKGSILNLRFTFSGIIALERVNIYFKTYYLKDDKATQKGVFSGIDNENRLVNGNLTLHFTAF